MVSTAHRGRDINQCVNQDVVTETFAPYKHIGV